MFNNICYWMNLNENYIEILLYIFYSDENEKSLWSICNFFMLLVGIWNGIIKLEKFGGWILVYVL